MASRILILLSLLVPLSSFAETASDYANRGAQKYIFGQDDAAEAEISTGLTKFPNDRELNQIAGLLRKKPKQEQKSQDQQAQQDQQSQSGSDDQQKPDKNKDGNENKEQKPGATPTPGDDQQNQPGSSPSPSADQGSGGDKSNPSPSPSPSSSGDPGQSPSPSPGDGESEQPDGSPSPSPGASPQKKLSGEVKGADGDKPNEPPQNGELVEAEPEKEGQMSEKQAQMLLQSMKDEERRVQLDERKAARPVYKDW